MSALSKAYADLDHGREFREETSNPNDINIDWTFNIVRDGSMGRFLIGRFISNDHKRMWLLRFCPPQCPTEKVYTLQLCLLRSPTRELSTRYKLLFVDCNNIMIYEQPWINENFTIRKIHDIFNSQTSPIKPAHMIYIKSLRIILCMSVEDIADTVPLVERVGDLADSPFVCENCYKLHYSHLVSDHRDLTINSNDMVFKSYQDVIASVSPLFRRSYEFAGHIRIAELDFSLCKASAVKEVLVFIYKKEWSDFETYDANYLMMVLECAFCFDVEELKTLLIDFIVDKLNRRNVIELTLKAETYCMHKLVLRGLDFIINNKASIRLKFSISERRNHHRLIDEIKRIVSGKPAKK